MDAKQLAAAIRKGHTMIGEAIVPFLSEKNDCGCALGAALVGTGFKFTSLAMAMSYQSSPSIARQLGADEELVAEVSDKHFSGMPRLAIADWLDTLDVSKPKDAQSFNDFMKVVTQPVEMEAA